MALLISLLMIFCALEIILLTAWYASIKKVNHCGMWILIKHKMMGGMASNRLYAIIICT